MATNKELKELKDKFNKLTPSDDPNSEYQKTLSKIREEQAERTSATQSAADKLATEKDRKDAAKKIKERTRDLSTIKALENEIRRQTDLGQTPSPAFQTQLNELREKYPKVVPETPKSVKVAESVTEPTPAPTPGAPTPTPTPKSKAKSAAEAKLKLLLKRLQQKQQPKLLPRKRINQKS
jgi:glucan-binding YG repeat protein